MVSKTILSIIIAAFPCDSTRENGVQESPQTFLNPEIINNFSAENIQSASGGYSKSFFLRNLAGVGFSGYGHYLYGFTMSIRQLERRAGERLPGLRVHLGDA